MRIARTILKKNKSGRLTLPDLQTCCKAAVSKYGSPGVRIDRRESRNRLNMYLVTSFLIKRFTQFYGGERRGVFGINSPGATGYL